jgi:hypothetical protein
MANDGVGGTPGGDYTGSAIRGKGDGTFPSPIVTSQKAFPSYLDVGDNVMPMSDTDYVQKYNKLNLEFNEKLYSLIDSRTHNPDGKMPGEAFKTEEERVTRVKELYGALVLHENDSLPTEYTQFNIEDWLNITCDDKRFFLPGVCENGHKVAKLMVCGKEWCPVCGAKGSIAHNRRFVRWLPKIQTFERMRYLVFTIPEDIRGRYRSKASLRALQRAVRDLLKRHGFDRGLMRYHWYGDDKRSEKQKAAGVKLKWHPHLNVLLEGGYMAGDMLQSIKDDYKDILGVDTVSVRTAYKPKPADMAGCLHYVTRATFLDCEWNVDMAIELHNFRNMVVWGRNWPETVWQLPAAEIKAVAGEKIDVEAIGEIVEHVCPVCKGHITWSTALPSQLLDCVDKRAIGAGYYIIQDRASPSLEHTIGIVCPYKAGAHGYDREWLKARVAELRPIREAEWEARKAEALANKEARRQTWIHEQLESLKRAPEAAPEANRTPPGGEGHD